MKLEDILALDVALRRNDTGVDGEHLPPEIDSQLVHKLYYGHLQHGLPSGLHSEKGVDVHV